MTKEETTTTTTTARKRRLSRKEQRARKKQKNKPHGALETANPPPPATATDLERTTAQDGDGGDDSGQSEPQDYLADYVPTPVPGSIDSEAAASTAASSLGKWFPKAKVFKTAINYSNAESSTTTAKASLLLFYQYASWSDDAVQRLMAYLTRVAETRKTLGGRIRIAPEGLNATISAVDGGTAAASSSQATLRHFCQDLKRFDPAVFEHTDFKFIDGVKADRAFKDLKLLPVKELVFYGVSEKEAPLAEGGTHVDARDFHALLEKKDAVVIDVRNHYEAAIGRFNGQADPEKAAEGGAEYIDPKMRKSTDFPKWLQQEDTKKKLKDKTVLMYCTGGVRCERASAYLNHTMGKEVKGVYQLQGGIERYLQAFPDGGHWKGKNFVFDKRESVSAENRDGDGGVVHSAAAADRATKETVCCVCSAPWDRYVGKKKCTMCGVPVLMCDACMTTKKKATNVVLRCPLCVEEDITVPASEVEYTNNGVSGRTTASKDGEAKAAPSVLKWGGGHAQSKKEKKKEQRRIEKLKKKPCQFGADCSRPDCFFSHPGGRKVPSSA